MWREYGHGAPIAEQLTFLKKRFFSSLDSSVQSQRKLRHSTILFM